MTTHLNITIDNILDELEVKAYVFQDGAIIGSLNGYRASPVIFNCLASLEVERIIKFARALRPHLELKLNIVSEHLLDETTVQEIDDVFARAQ